MHLTIKPSSKIMKPCSFVDTIFEAQGFEKNTRKDAPYYQLILKDNITRTNYEVKVPFQEVYVDKIPLYKIQDIFISTRSQHKKNNKIPTEIIHAANEKVHEVFSYLITNKQLDTP